MLNVSIMGAMSSPWRSALSSASRGAAAVTMRRLGLADGESCKVTKFRTQSPDLLFDEDQSSKQEGQSI